MHSLSLPKDTSYCCGVWARVLLRVHNGLGPHKGLDVHAPRDSVGDMPSVPPSVQTAEASASAKRRLNSTFELIIVYLFL
jgi:hypothetical protein